MVAGVCSCAKFCVRLTVCSVLLLAMAPDTSQAKWIIDENDKCVWVWTPTALIRGPVALANVPTIPIRTITSMWVGIGRKQGMAEGAKHALLLGPLFGLGFVVVETLWATAETLTGGYRPLLTEDEAEMYRKPLIPPVEAAVQDPCHRPSRTVNEVTDTGPSRALNVGHLEPFPGASFTARTAHRSCLQAWWAPLRPNQPLEPTATCIGSLD